MVAPACPVHAKDFQRLRRAPLRPKPIRRRHGSPPRRWAPAPASPPSAPLGLGRWGCRAAAAGRRPWECIAAEPAAGDTCRARSADAEVVKKPLDALLLDLGQRHPDRRPPRRDSASPAATPPGGCHPSRSGPSGRESAVPGIAWPRPTVERCNWRTLSMGGCPPGDWDRTCRPCPRTCPRDSPDHRRGPSLPSRCSSRRSAVLRPPRTPAAHASLSPSAYTSAPAPTRRRRRASRVPFLSVHACCAPYPAETLARVHPRTGAREDMAFAAT